MGTNPDIIRCIRLGIHLPGWGWVIAGIIFDWRFAVIGLLTFLFDFFVFSKWRLFKSANK